MSIDLDTLNWEGSGYVVTVNHKPCPPTLSRQNAEIVLKWLCESEFVKEMNIIIDDNKRLRADNKFLAEKNIDYRLENTNLKTELVLERKC